MENNVMILGFIVWIIKNRIEWNLGLMADLVNGAKVEVVKLG
jgi:hypothetical protein